MNDAQVVIIGGGVMGTSLLYHLVQMGWQDVFLLEKNDLTHGSTWHAAGLCTHFAHNATIQELRATSVRLYRDILPAKTGQSCGFHSSGAMRITRNPDRMDEFRHVAGLSAFTGYPLEVLTPDRIAELHPLARLDGLLGGIFEPDDGRHYPNRVHARRHEQSLYHRRRANQGAGIVGKTFRAIHKMLDADIGQPWHQLQCRLHKGHELIPVVGQL